MEAIDAHLLVFAGSCAQSLPAWLPDWLEQWATRRHIEDAALAVIGDGNDHVFSASAPLELSRFAGLHGLSFIINDRAAVEDKEAVRLPG
jgi:hypothetical protein